MMNDDDRGGTRSERVGWMLLLAVAGLLTLNGVGWFFVGPSLAFFDPGTGTVGEFRAAYPGVADSIATNARQVAIWFMGFGLMALTISWHGLRRGSALAWRAALFLAVTPAAVGVNVLISGEGSFGAGIVVLAAVAFLGLFLARPAAPRDPARRVPSSER